MAYGDSVKYRDNRTGKFRKATKVEKNQYFRGTLMKGLANFQFKSGTIMAEKAAEFAQDLVAYAQANAPWEDRSGAARRGLSSEVTVENEEFNINLFHTVDYGIWLEIRWGGRYAIILPTLETMGAQLYDKMSGIFSETIYYHD